MRFLKTFLITSLLILGSLVLPAFGLKPEKGALFVRVVDVGQGLCCIVVFPDESVMVYDAGNFNSKASVAAVMNSLHALLDVHKPIALLVLSHSDHDHIGAVKDIIDQYWVERILRPGIAHPTKGWEIAERASHLETLGSLHREINLAEQAFWPGSTTRYGGVYTTMLSGFNEPPEEWGVKGDSDHYNAGSIVIRLQFGKQAVMLTGDAVGRHREGGNSDIFATEKFILEMSEVMRIDADVLVAPHHGGDNGSSTAFIKAVDPKYVIFSAGRSSNDHPRKSTAERYLKAGIPANHIFRTDRGDNEGSLEWDHEGGPVGAKDGAGDDHVDILIREGQEAQVEYGDADSPLPAPDPIEE